MGEELPMARSEEEGWAMLLASIGSGASSIKPPRRDKRKKKASNSKGKEGGKVQDSSPKGKVSAEAEGPDARPKRGRHRQDNSDRKRSGGVEGENGRPRRNSQELGVEHPGSFCPSGEPHYFAQNEYVDGGVLFKCNKCLKYLWLPSSLDGANQLSVLMNKHGKNEGYQRYLNRYRAAKIRVAKMQDLWYISQEVEDEVELARIIVRVMAERDYDKVKEE